MSEDNKPVYQAGEVWESIPVQYEILGSWSGQDDDDFVKRLRERGFTCVVQAETCRETAISLIGLEAHELPDDWKPRVGLAVMSREYWSHRIIHTDEIMAVRKADGSLLSLNHQPDGLRKVS